MQVLESKVTEVIRRTDRVISVRVCVDDSALFQAGQFLEVVLLSEGLEVSRYLSFSSAPTEPGYIEFTKSITDSNFSRALSCLKPGDSVRMKLPLGKFILDEGCAKHAFLAGGIGITPMRSIWQGAFDRKLAVDMVMLYSNRAAEDILFRADFENMAAQNPGYKVIFSLDTRDKCPVDWYGRCGYINAAMIQEEIPDYQERIFYICGPVVMVKKMVDILSLELGVRAENIRRESITGY